VPEGLNAEYLLNAASRAAASGYAPYSGTQVGAALIAAGGKLYTGCNLEVINFSGSICAERGALAAAVVAGERGFTAVAVMSESFPDCYPCGICREVLGEFGDMKVVVRNASGEPVVTDLSALIPGHFKMTDITPS
jgi:cytidine deaminase